MGDSRNPGTADTLVGVNNPEPQSLAFPTAGSLSEIVLTPKNLGCQNRLSRTSIYRSDMTKLSNITTSQTLGGTVMMMLAEPKPPPTRRQ